MQETVKNAEKRINYRERARLLFYISIVVLPLLQFSIFYIYINFNSIKMAFFTYKSSAEGYYYEFAAFKNFADAFKLLGDSGYMVKNSMTMWLVHLIIGTPLQFLFSFYIAKRYAGAGFFKVILFLPQVISSLVFALLYKYMVTDVFLAVADFFGSEVKLGLLDNPKTQFPMVVVYQTWIGFGTGMLMYSNAISAIPQEIIESAHLDGANLFQEFIHITLPSIWPTYSSMFLIGVTGILLNQGGLHAMFGTNATHIGTLGYYIFVEAQRMTEGMSGNFSLISALGLILSMILIPLTLFTKWALKRFGPSED